LKKDYILVLPSWYPGKLGAFNGDFNERLVQSLKDKRFQVVLYINTIRGNKTTELEIIEEGDLIVYKYYYKHDKNVFLHSIKLLFIYRKFFKIIFKKYGLPKIVHTYVFFPAGIGVLYLKLKYNLKHFLTEHYTIFSKSRSKNIYNDSSLLKLIYHKILNSFQVIICVSEDLKKSILNWNKNADFHVLPNVVNTDYFNFRSNNLKESKSFRFIHVSAMGYTKNVNEILIAFKNVINNDSPLILDLVGPATEEIISQIKTDKILSKHVNILGELNYKEVALAMKRSDAFVLFSLYENMPCVILEALCCGLPVISSNVGGVKEVLNHSNSIIVESRNLTHLENAFNDVYSNYEFYNRSVISENASNAFSYHQISNDIDVIYSDYFNK
jgi:glycosyltransferase involved in cell wall biosynthesis